MAYVASGRFDGFFQENLNIWDIASGILLIQEAGGIINKADIKKINGIEVIASNPNINEKMVKILISFNCFIKIIISLDMKKDIHPKYIQLK